MIRRALAVTAIVVMTSASAAHAAKRSRPCPSPHSRVVAADVDGRVYRIDNRKAGDVDFYACLTRGRGHRFLANQQQDAYTAYKDFRLASPYVAYVEYSGSTAGSSVTPTIHNIRTGAKVAVAVDDSVYALEVTHRGGLLVLWGGPNPHDPFVPIKTPQLLYRSRLGQRLVLDTGDGIDRASVAVSRDGTHAYWTKSGLPFTAALT